MLDKLEMKTREGIDPRALKDLLPGQQITQVPDRWYDFCAIIKINGKHLLSMKTGPKWGNVSPSKVLINPCNWGTFTDLHKTLSRICDPSLLEFTRIDHAVDLDLPIDRIHSGLRVRYKQDFEGHKEREKFGKKKGVLTGFYLGKKPELYCCYDKAYQLHTKALKRSPGNPIGVKSRIELRQWKNKIQFKTLADLPNYLQSSPFKNLEYYEVQDGRDRGNELAELIAREGLSSVYHLKNQSRNFKRDYSKLLVKTGLPEALGEAYSQELKAFLEG